MSVKDKEMKRIERSVVRLKKSPLYLYRKDNGYKVVIGEGALDAPVVFVGEAPGRKEAETGKPFCGASGRVFNELLTHIKLDRESVYVTNIVKDRPPANRDPSKAEIELYKPYLIEQIELIQPKVIATLGRHPMSVVIKHFLPETNLLSIGEMHGKLLEVDAKWGRLYIIPLYHPAFTLYNRKNLSVLKKDFIRIKKLLK